MKTLAVAMVFGFGFAAFGMGVAVEDLELSEKGYEDFDGEIAEVSHGNIKEGDFAGWKLFTKAKVTSCAKRVAPNGSTSYKCQEITRPPVVKNLFGFPRAAGRVLAIMSAAPPLSSEDSEKMYVHMQNIPEVGHGPIQEKGDFMGWELFTKSILVVYAKMVGPDGFKFVKKLVTNPSLE